MSLTWRIILHTALTILYNDISSTLFSSLRFLWNNLVCLTKLSLFANIYFHIIFDSMCEGCLVFHLHTGSYDKLQHMVFLHLMSLLTVEQMWFFAINLFIIILFHLLFHTQFTSFIHILLWIRCPFFAFTSSAYCESYMLSLHIICFTFIVQWILFCVLWIRLVVV